MRSIVIGNHKSQVKCELELLNELREFMAIKAMNYFWSAAWRKRQWDGKVQYVSERGYFLTGLLPKVLEFMQSHKKEIKLVWNETAPKPYAIPETIGLFTLRDYQDEGLKALFNSYIGSKPFFRGVFAQATNAGKTLLAGGVFQAYEFEIPVLYLVNRQHIYEQAKKELEEMFPNKIGYIGKDGQLWRPFTIAMVKTLGNSLPKFAKAIAQVGIVIVDECHMAGSKTFEKVLNKLINVPIRIGMSGTPFRHKDKNKNEKILGFFGPVISSITNKELIDKGHSAPITVGIYKGNDEFDFPKDYPSEETFGIIENHKRNLRILKRVDKQIEKQRLPLMVVTKRVAHCELLYELIKERYPNIPCNFLHVNVKGKDRTKRLKQFKVGKLKILVSTQLIKEGSNLPLMKSMIIAGGGDSAINTLQLVGRLLRTHKTKSKVILNDFFDKGSYLRKHSKHRIREYKNQGFKIKFHVTIK